MKRINIYSETEEGRSFDGWFDMDAATEIARYQSGSPYTSGKILLATAKGKLVVNDWNNTGYDSYRFAIDEEEIAEILVEGGYNEDKDERLSEILAKYEM